MKRFIFPLLALLIAVAFLIAFASHNYNNAISAVMMTEGTDLDIEITMSKYGFNKAWHEDIDMMDKIVALFN